MRSLFVAAAGVVVALSFAAPAQAQFRNQAFVIQGGWIGLGSTWDTVLHGGRPARQNFDNNNPEPGWNIHDQPMLGLGHTFAVGYQLWVESDATLGILTTVLDQEVNRIPVMSLIVGGGLRYNFMEERHRPYATVRLETITLLPFPPAAPAGPVPIPTNNLFGGTAFFGAVRPGFGYEYVFGDEQSLFADLTFMAVLAPDASGRAYGSLFLPAHVLRAGWMIYF